VSTAVASPRPPPSFPPAPGRRRPLEAAARPPDRGALLPPLSGSGEEEGHICPKPPDLPPYPEPL
jgi:hypothetical protein